MGLLYVFRERVLQIWISTLGFSQQKKCDISVGWTRA